MLSRQLPVLALAALDAETDLRPAAWGLMTFLEDMGIAVQAFQSGAQFVANDGAAVATGRPTRYIDPWLMNDAQCAIAMNRSAGEVDMGLLMGKLSPGAGTAEQQFAAMSLRMGLPMATVIPTSRPLGDLPPLVHNCGGVFLLASGNLGDMLRWRFELEEVHDIPVLGVIDEDPATELVLRHLKPQARPSHQLLRRLADNLDRTLDVSEMTNMLRFGSAVPSLDRRRFVTTPDFAAPCIGIAFDESINQYHGDALEALELAGGSVIEFSPLKSHTLPTNIDMLHIGGGPIERYAQALATNCCLRNQLQQFARQGGRILATGSGAAWLCREIIDAAGESHAGMGLVDCRAIYDPASHASPMAIRVPHNTWLLPEGETLQGYKTPHWIFESPESSQRCDLMVHGNTIVTSLEMHPLVEPHLQAAIFGPLLESVV